MGKKKAIIGASGGVDSSVTLAIAKPVLKDRLLPIIIDTGALREEELLEMDANVRACGAIPKIIDESLNFFSAIGNATDGEIKRKRFQSVYGPCLDREGKVFGAEFIFQGTNKADRIESAKAGQSTLIKTHHNMVEMELIKYDPLKELFKYEIRVIARLLGLPESISERMPSPGPNLFIRVNGISATPENVAIVRWADMVVTQIFRNHDICKDISQYTVNLNGVPTVGIKGDGRAYKYSIVIHPVVTMDFMTSTGYQIADFIRREITREVQKHPEIIRVLFDEGDKPPASTEWE